MRWRERKKERQGTRGATIVSRISGNFYGNSMKAKTSNVWWLHERARESKRERERE